MSYGQFYQFIEDDLVPVQFAELHTAHLRGKSLQGVWAYLFPWVRIPQYRLLDYLVYLDRYSRFHVVDLGFEFNGASVPWWLWWLVMPDHPCVIAPSCLHDSHCTKQQAPEQTEPYEIYLIDSDEAAIHFYDTCKRQGMRWRSFYLWLAVRLFGPQFFRGYA
jgi:hypothetical protein